MRVNLFFFLLTVITGFSLAYPQQPANPVVGILSAPLEECPPVPPNFHDRLPARAASQNITSCVFSYGVRLLQSVGARTVVFPWNLSYPQQLALLRSVNGLWIPGGGLWGAVHQEYKAAVNRLYHMALAMNLNHDPVVLWGTCYGMELVVEAAAEAPVIKGGYHGMDPIMMNLTFTSDQPTSRMLGTNYCPASIRRILTTESSTLNWHERGLPLEAFNDSRLLRERMVPLAWSTEPAPGLKRFVAAVEATGGAEIYGVQFHPERPPFEFANDAIGHTSHDIAVSNYFANFIVDRMRRCNHTFTSPEAAEALRVSQWPLLDLGWGIETYFVVDPPFN